MSKNDLIIIDLDIHNPALNLKIEEELLVLSKTTPHILRFWINSKAIIMGRFQNINYEVDQKFTSSQNIPIFKRFSGGGTVYHDTGTLNISLFKNKNKSSIKTTCFNKKATAIINESLNELGFDSQKNERNALFINSKKILGSAAYMKEDVFLYHASLLVDTDLENLNNSIISNPKYDPKNKKPFVKSVRSPVMNLSDIAPQILMDDIKNGIINYLINEYKISNIKIIKTYKELRSFYN